MNLAESITWVGIAVCVSQSAVFSGLNLAMFGLNRLSLEVAASRGDGQARRVLGLRRDSNFLLATILWGNVAANCLLTILSDSVLAGATAFLFSTVLITCVGEIMPQAYFSRNALRMGVMLEPLIRFYQFIFYPIARPTAVVLDWWLGREGINYLREADLREVLRRHLISDESDLDVVEARGALNFLALDDVPAGEVGEPLAPNSVVKLPFSGNRPVLPEFEKHPADPFVRQLLASGCKWAVIVDQTDVPRLAVNVSRYLRDLLASPETAEFFAHTSTPIVVADPETPLGGLINQFWIVPDSPRDDVIDHDVILVWAGQRRIITGADLLGRLLRGIAKRLPANRW
jgi:metal transporter CNNM